MRRWKRDPYVRIGGAILIIIVAASFYIYQRVWVRSLIAETEQLQKRNEQIRQQTSLLRSEWMSATSIASLETTIAEKGLALEPTKPTQNMALRPRPEWEGGRYEGLLKALEKLAGHVPLVRSNEAEASQLFQDE
jgi:cell division protein FtsL